MMIHMPLRNILITIALATFLAFMGVASFVLFIPPTDLPSWMVLVFYSVLFLGLVGLFTIIGVVGRVYIRKADVPVRQLTRSLRQGTFFSMLVIAALLLSHFGMLSTWTLLLLILGLAFIELFFLTSKSRAV